MRRVAAALRAKRSWAAYGQAGIAIVALFVVATGLWFALDRYIYGGFEPIHAYGLNCGDVLDRLPSYVAGQVEGDEMAEIEWHLERCRRCYDRYRELGGDRTFAAALQPDINNAAFTPPAGLPSGGAPAGCSSHAKPCCESASP